MQFKRAVTNLVGADEKVGLALSGGLDSRAILAAVPDNYSPLHTFTFGQDNCLDIQIAQHASEVRKAIHHIQPITSDNWLQSRISEIWLSDGSINLYHLHEIGSCNTYRSHMDFNLSGFLGDGILGGSYLHYKDSEAYNLTNRGRRFINLANILGETRLIYRRPFFDNDFFNLTFSIPQQLRKNSYIYNKMLLNTFPEYFRKIPWQKTGFPIGYSDRHKRILRFKNNAVDKITQKMRRFGLSYIKPHKSFTDYNDWIRKEPARTIFSKILFNKNALYKEFYETHCFSKYFDEHMRGKANYSIELCVLLTFEIWLQQVFEKKYRDNETNRIYCRS
jgi:asparagine synthase (glutamine-hydrolysing)